MIGLSPATNPKAYAKRWSRNVRLKVERVVLSVLIDFRSHKAR